MSYDAKPVAADFTKRHELLFLYSWNLKLRHLQGISIRNLHVATAKPALVRKTAVDDGPISSAIFPTGRLLHANLQALQHSLSSSDISSTARSFPSLPGTSLATDEKTNEINTKSRPPKLRRRSTLQWTGASARARQEKLEDVAEYRIVDTWFSLHSDENDGTPFYISEVMERSMNPSFRFFDLAAGGFSLARSDRVKVRLWARTSRMKGYLQLLDLDVNLRSLHFIGKTLENFHHPLPVNCVLFHMSDGVYTSFADISAETGQRDPIGLGKQQNHFESTSSFDALMQLANLDDCIQDALSTRHALEKQINALLEHREEADHRSKRSAQARRALLDAENALAVETRSMHQARRRIDDLRHSAKVRQERMSRGRVLRQSAKGVFENLQYDSTILAKKYMNIDEATTGQLRRICEDIQVVFPIDPIRNKTLHFSIKGVYLPNAAFDDTNRDEIAAALGMTARLIHLLSLYLSAPLPYRIDMAKGEPYIEDRISVALTQRRFPLQPTNVAYKFEYGVFLLNKDLEFLMAKAGLRTMDIRHTLPNLKYLLYILTAGTGELPTRKAGGVRGLPGGKTVQDLSRRSSQDSVSTSSAYAPQPQPPAYQAGTSTN